MSEYETQARATLRRCGDRRTFVHAETRVLGEFLEPAGDLLVSWSRSYRCECGFRGAGAREIHDHSATCHGASTNRSQS